MKSKGFALIALIFLIVLIGILIVPTVSIVWQTTRFNTMEVYSQLAYDAAWAGVNKAAYELLQNSSASSAEAQLNGTQYYKYAFNGSLPATGAEHFYIDAHLATQPTNRQVTGWTMINNSTKDAAVITQMQLSWISAANNLLSIQLNGNPVWSGTATSGTTIDIPDTTVPFGSTEGNNLLVFNGNMANVSVYTTFFFANGTATTRRVWKVQNPVLPDGGPWYPTGAQSWWKMNENAGTTVYDMINPNGANPPNDLTTGGAGTTWTSSGKFGSAVAFNGSNTAYLAGTNSSSLTNASFSVSAWIYLNSLPGANITYGIFCRANATPAARGYELYVNNNNDAIVANRNKIIWAIGPNGVSNKAVSTSVPTTAAWIHVAGTYNGTNAILYVDSVRNATVASAYSANGTFYIGRRNTAANNCMNGLIDEAIFYNRALTSTEVLSIYTPNIGSGAGVVDTVTSTGIVKDNGTNVVMRKTIVATFDVSGSSMNMTGYTETIKHLMP